MNAISDSIRVVVSAILAAILLPGMATEVFAQDGEAELTPRIVRSAGGRTQQRTDSLVRDRATLVESEVQTVERPDRNSKGDSATANAVLDEAWVYDANVELFDDYDGDGYFTYMRVSFDADSIYAGHYLYARLFITLDGINWDEYHITEDFLVEGSTSFDTYEVETELVSGYPPGLYDVLIELYDADFGYFLAEFGPAQSSAFSLLPLEDINSDIAPTTVVISTESGGGASELFTLTGLVIFAAIARIRRRRSNLDRRLM